jgi:ABC-type transporter MlaC component
MLRQTLHRLLFSRIAPRKPTPRALAAVMMIAVLLSPPAVRAEGEQPRDTLRQGIEEGLRILRHPNFAAEAQRPRQRQQLRELLERVFDFNEFSRRVLAEHWVRFTPRERAEFVGVFRAFLEKYYLSQLQERYRGEKVITGGQEMVAPDRAETQVTVLWNGREIPVAVRMHRRGPDWRAYDVSVLGISGVQIYRAQLRELLGRNSPAQVIALIRRRLEE